MRKQNLPLLKKVLGSSSQYNYIGMFIFSLIGAYFADYFRQYIWYISAFLMMITTIFGLFFLDDLKGEQKLRKAHSLISDAREMLSFLLKLLISLYVFIFLLYCSLSYWRVFSLQN